jgi:predicted amidophosphoribosyltransferase
MTPKSEKSASATCQRCGKPLVFDKFTLCYDCRALEKADVQRALDYLATHRGATLKSVSQATGVDEQTVLRLIQGGRVETLKKKK